MTATIAWTERPQTLYTPPTMGATGLVWPTDTHTCTTSPAQSSFRTWNSSPPVSPASSASYFSAYSSGSGWQSPVSPMNLSSPLPLATFGTLKAPWSDENPYDGTASYSDDQESTPYQLDRSYSSGSLFRQDRTSRHSRYEDAKSTFHSSKYGSFSWYPETNIGPDLMCSESEATTPAKRPDLCIRPEDQLEEPNFSFKSESRSGDKSTGNSFASTVSRVKSFFKKNVAGWGGKRETEGQSGSHRNRLRFIYV